VKAGPWLLGLIVFPFSVAHVGSRWKRFQVRVAGAKSTRERQLVRVERWMWIGAGIMFLGGTGAALSVDQDAWERLFLGIGGIGAMLTVGVSVTSGWMRGGSTE
jgi:hypothetical protein